MHLESRESWITPAQDIISVSSCNWRGAGLIASVESGKMIPAVPILMSILRLHHFLSIRAEVSMFRYIS